MKKIRNIKDQKKRENQDVVRTGKNMEQIYKELCLSLSLSKSDCNCINNFENDSAIFGNKLIKKMDDANNPFTTFSVGLETIGISSRKKPNGDIITRIGYWFNDKQIHMVKFHITVLPDNQNLND